MNRNLEMGIMRLGVQVGLGALALVTLFTFSIIQLSLRHEYETLLANQGAQLLETARINGLMLRKEVSDLRADTLFLSRVPPIQGIVRATLNQDIDQRDGNSTALWKKRLEEIFAAQIESHPEYVQIRYVGMADNGWELVRVDQREGRTATIPPDELQTIADLDYFKAAVKLRAGEVYLSEINLSQKQGRIATPHVRTLRAATPIFGPDGKVFGIVIISLAAQDFLPNLTNGVAPHALTYLANMDGDYLLHPDASRSFGFDLGRRYRWQDDMPGLQVQAENSLALQKLSLAEGIHYAAAVRVPFDPLQPKRHWVLIYLIPETALVPRSGDAHHQLIASIAMVAVLTMMLLLWLVRRTFAPLGQLTLVAHDMAAGKYDTPIPDVGKGDVGTLAVAFQSMQDGVAEREARWRAVGSTSGDGFWMVDTTGRIMEVNEAYVRRSGYAREELLAMWVSDLEVYESPEDILRRIEKIRRTGSDLFETEHRCKDGTLWSTEVRVSYWPIADGRLFAFMRDITERKRAEQQLREERDRTRLYLEVAEIFIVVLDSEARVRLINRKGCETLGWSEAEIIGQPWPNYCAEPVRAEWSAYFTDLMAARAVPQGLFEYPVATRDGVLRVIEWRRVVLRDDQGKPCGTVSSGRDVTEERRAQQALGEHQALLEKTVEERTADLKTSEARTRAILTTMLDGLVHIDAHGIILSVNLAVQEMFGYEEGEMVGHSVVLLMPDPPASVHDDYIDRYLRTRQPHILGKRLETVARRKDGSQFPIELAVNEMADDAGSSFIGLLRDMTKQKAAEQILQEAMRAVQAAAEAKSRFLANMSHEIRTPLNGVLGLARIGLRESKGRKTAEICARILESGQHLLGVINDILDFSKIDAGKLRIEQRPFALLGAIDNVKSFIEARAKAKGLALSFSLAADLPEWVEGDALRLVQILTNLLSNAIKFTARGEVLLRIARDGDNVCFKVIDTGIGMSEEQQARLFQSFEQADSSTTRNYGGTGLGLSISQSLAHLMGGEIIVDSQPGAGSSFFLQLPLPAAAAPEHPSQSGTAADASGPRLTGLSVLAADDVEVNRIILDDLLTQEGARVVLANDGQQVLEWLEQEGARSFDVVLMDVQMPVMDGLEATQHIAEIAPGLSVIGLTAHALAEERDKCLAAGMVDHVTKPIDTDVLVAAILRHARYEASLPMTTTPTATAVPPAPTLAAGLIDHAALLENFKGRREFIAKLAASVGEHHAGTPARLREAARVDDLETLAFVAHTLKGVAGNLNAGPLHEAALALETAVKAGGEDTPALAGPLADVLEATLKELAKLESAP